MSVQSDVSMLSIIGPYVDNAHTHSTNSVPAAHHSITQYLCLHIAYMLTPEVRHGFFKAGSLELPCSTCNLLQVGADSTELPSGRLAPWYTRAA